MKHITCLFALAPGLVSASKCSPGPLHCSPDIIDISPIVGLEVVSIETSTVFNSTVASLPNPIPNSFPQSANFTIPSFCNVTVTTRRPGYAVRGIGIKTSVYLPLDGWNERMMGIGGSGFVAGNAQNRVLAPLVSGWATVSTSGGVSVDTLPASTETQNSDAWALRSTGNVDTEALADFGYRALGDAAAIGQDVIESFYGKPAQYRYWNGCSTGGRQGLMLAQRYPQAYHGILGSCPAINWSRFLSTDIMPQIVLKGAAGSDVPPPCMLKAITAAALKECDEIDGVKDGYVMDPSTCHFNASSVQGQTIDCPDVPSGTAIISEGAVLAAEAAWAGYHTVDGEWRWYGVSRTTNITGDGTLVNTVCAAEGTCSLSPFGIALSWTKNFLMKDLAADPMTLTHAQFDRLWQLSVQEWSSFLNTDDPDLRPFRDAGGKFVLWHGLDDIQIHEGGTEQYYKRVLAVDPSAADYIRFFQAPGIGHCSGGFGAYPGKSFESLVNWVEHDTEPETLYGRTSGGAERNLCLYPKKIVYNGGKDTNNATSFDCV